jgi:hypothetical protein
MVLARTDLQDVRFDGLAILQIAEEVERKASIFYLAAAEQACERKPRELYRRLGSWRRRRREALGRRQREHAETTGRLDAYDSDDSVMSNPRVMAGLTWSGTCPVPRGRSVRSATSSQILRDAIIRSKGIVIFFHGLKGFVDGPDSLATLDELMDGETRYIRILHRVLARMQSSTDEPAAARRPTLLTQR